VALATSATPARSRDFTLSAADAQRLRGSGWRRVVRFFGSSRDAFSRPLAIGFTTIGVVALLITAAPSIPLGGGSASAVLSTVGNAVPGQAAGAAPAAASPAASAAPPSYTSEFGPAASPAASSVRDRQSVSAKPVPYGDTGGGVFSGSSEASGRAGDILAEKTTGLESITSAGNDGVSIGLVIAGISLIIGFGLFALRWTSRRFGDG
jgi:hypothetical protein